MKKYIYSPTGIPNYFNVAKSLFEANIAEPVLWLGDPVHKDNVEGQWQGVYLDLDNLRFFNKKFFDSLKKIESTEIVIKYLISNEYFICKDICLKMMDRVDLYYQFSRTDREVVFHSVLLKLLNLIQIKNPDVFLFVEAPHSFPQYILLSISRYFNIPAYNFDSCNILPLMVLKNLNTHKIFSYHSNSASIDVINKFSRPFNQFLLDLKSKELIYMRKQKQFNWRLKISKYFTILKYGLKDLSNLIKYDSSNYSPINPIGINRVLLQLTVNRRIKILKKYGSYGSFDIPAEKFIYYALHKEPERTTNPDGGIHFHDQFKAISLLSQMFSDYTILVKEHSSQLNTNLKNIDKGRSPLFYDLISQYINVKIINVNVSSKLLIEKSSFVATISGTVALEAIVYEKKALVFGNSWYNGCPGIFSYDSNFKPSDIIDSLPISQNNVYQFFKNEYLSCTVRGFLNKSYKKLMLNWIDSEEMDEDLLRCYKTLFSNL